MSHFVVIILFVHHISILFCKSVLLVVIRHPLISTFLDFSHRGRHKLLISISPFLSLIWKLKWMYSRYRLSWNSRRRQDPWLKPARISFKLFQDFLVAFLHSYLRKRLYFLRSIIIPIRLLTYYWDVILSLALFKRVLKQVRSDNKFFLISLLFVLSWYSKSIIIYSQRF